MMTTQQIAAQARTSLRTIRNRAKHHELVPAAMDGHKLLWTSAQARKLRRPVKIGRRPNRTA